MEEDTEEIQTCQGYYHKFNCLKFRIAYTLFLFKEPKDTTQIADFLNEPQNKISNALSRYKKKDIPYFRRIKKWKGASNHDVKWMLTRSGVNFLANCMININNGLDFNFKRNRPQVNLKDIRVLHAMQDKMTFDHDQYAMLFGINCRGSEDLKISLEDVLKRIPTSEVEGKICYT
jgi:hypothetical protein